MNNTSTISAAFTLDLIIGDPEWIPHLVRGLGTMITYLEHNLLQMINCRKTGGIILLVTIAGFSYLGGITTLYIAKSINQFVTFCASTCLIYFTISVKDLYKESMSVYKQLVLKDIEQARKNLSRIVGRDTKNLPETEIIRATVETVAEGIVDGIVSPLFYASIGGAPLALLYRSVNTLDSMVGYKNEKYKDFGWASARFDDLLNYIPARLSGLFIPFVTYLLKRNWALSLLTVIDDSRNHPSPNSGFPEAAMAGALDMKLGGASYYKGVVSNKPKIGTSHRINNINDILSANKIMLVTSVFSLSFFLVLASFFG